MVFSEFQAKNLPSSSNDLQELFRKWNIKLGGLCGQVVTHLNCFSLPCSPRIPWLPMYVMTPKIFEKVQKKLGSRMYDFPLLSLSLPSFDTEMTSSLCLEKTLCLAAERVSLHSATLPDITSLHLTSQAVLLSVLLAPLVGHHCSTASTDVIQFLHDGDFRWGASRKQNKVDSS